MPCCAPSSTGPPSRSTFALDFDAQFDQAGVLVRADEEHWVKAGVEVSDGVQQLGAVATHGRSDWSVAPVPAWSGRDVTVRASRTGDALTVRARSDAGSWQLVRVAPLPPGDLLDGPLLLCADPRRAGRAVLLGRPHRGGREPASLARSGGVRRALRSVPPLSRPPAPQRRRRARAPA